MYDSNMIIWIIYHMGLKMIVHGLYVYIYMYIYTYIYRQIDRLDR